MFWKGRHSKDMKCGPANTTNMDFLTYTSIKTSLYYLFGHLQLRWWTITIVINFSMNVPTWPCIKTLENTRGLYHVCERRYLNVSSRISEKTFGYKYRADCIFFSWISLNFVALFARAAKIHHRHSRYLYCPKLLPQPNFSPNMECIRSHPNSTTS
jgi:hypothetical protein